MSKDYNLSTKHATDEVLEHVIMEKTGVLKGHHDHFLPKGTEKTIKGEKKVEKKTETKVKAGLKSSDSRFFLIAYAIVALEFWILYKGVFDWNLLP